MIQSGRAAGAPERVVNVFTTTDGNNAHRTAACVHRAFNNDRRREAVHIGITRDDRQCTGRPTEEIARRID